MEKDQLDVIHVDMDAFFAAVEALDEPALFGKPVIVGGTGLRGVVASCSYEARASGVRSAMPMTEARRRCPGAIVVGGRHDRYGEVSRQLHEVLHEFTPSIEPIALDEAFLDVSGSHRLFGTSPRIAWAIRARVREQLSLDCSVGVGRSKLIAKLASRDAKPRPSPAGPVEGAGVVVVYPEEEVSFLQPRPVRDLWGVGPKTAERLARYGIHKIADLAALDRSALERMLGGASGRQLAALAHGDDPRPVEPSRPVKSIGHEETFPSDVHDAEALGRELVRLADSVGSRLRRAGVKGRTVNLKVRFGTFRTITRAHSLGRPLVASSEIARIGAALLDGVDVSGGVRLIGLSVSSLESDRRADEVAGRQLSFAEAEREGVLGKETGEPELVMSRLAAREDVERAVDAIRRRYGATSVGPATVLSRSGLAVKQLGDSQWGPSESGGEGSDRPRTRPGRPPKEPLADSSDVPRDVSDAPRKR